MVVRLKLTRSDRGFGLLKVKSDVVIHSGGKGEGVEVSQKETTCDQIRVYGVSVIF